MAQDMSIDVQEIRHTKGPRIVVVGVGGGGSNMVSHLYQNNAHDDLTLIVANTDNQHLGACPVPNKIQLGERITGGLGAGADDEIGKKATLESTETIKEYLAGANMVIVCVGLGGGTGTGAAPVVAQIAKDLGAVTISIATKPFAFEGSQRAKVAQRGFEELNKVSDSIIVVPNDKLRSIIGRNTGVRESFKIVDNVLARAAGGISSVVLKYSPDDVNVDFADLKKVITTYKGLALMGLGEGSGENACLNALRNAIESPLFDNLSINGAKGIILNFEFNPDYPFTQVTEAMEFINEIADGDDNLIIFGTRTDENLAVDFMRITVIATGFEKNITSSTPTNTTQASVESKKKKKILNSPFSFDVALVSGGDEIVDYDKPTYMRHKKD